MMLKRVLVAWCLTAGAQLNPAKPGRVSLCCLEVFSPAQAFLARYKTGEMLSAHICPRIRVRTHNGCHITAYELLLWHVYSINR